MQHACLLAGLTGGGWMPPALIKGVAGAPRDENSAFRRNRPLKNCAFHRCDAGSCVRSDGPGMVESGIDLGCCIAERTARSALSA